MSLTLGKPVIKAQFMDDEMREFAIVEALKALENGYNEKVSVRASHARSSLPRT